MDCQFCNTIEAVHVSVPTAIGIPADLCDECASAYGPRTKRLIYKPTMPMGGVVIVTPYRSFYDDDQSNT